MTITEDIIDDLVGDIVDIMEPSRNRDELWLRLIVPLSFEALEYCEKDLTADGSNTESRKNGFTKGLIELKLCY